MDIKDVTQTPPEKSFYQKLGEHAKRLPPDAVRAIAKGAGVDEPDLGALDRQSPKFVARILAALLARPVGANEELLSSISYGEMPDPVQEEIGEAVKERFVQPVLVAIHGILHSLHRFYPRLTTEVLSGQGGVQNRFAGFHPALVSDPLGYLREFGEGSVTYP